MVPMDLYDELVALVDALERQGSGYAICGGIAVALHGYPRFTRDIDLLIRREDLPKVLAGRAQDLVDLEHLSAKQGAESGDD